MEKIFGPGNQYVTAAKMILQVYLLSSDFFSPLLLSLCFSDLKGVLGCLGLMSWDHMGGNWGGQTKVAVWGASVAQPHYFSDITYSHSF